MELRPGYKQTEIGMVPEEWGIEPLIHIGQWFSGGTPSLSNESYWSGDIPWVSPKDMKQLRLSDAIDHISQKAIADGARVLPVGAILMVIRGMILAHSFPVARVERPLAFNQDIKAVVPRTDVDSNFVLYWLIANKQRLRSLITESTHGTKRLPSETLFKSKVCVPRFPEQRAIATTLSDVDALLAKLDQFIAKKRNLKQAAMQQLLTGQTRLPGFTEAWEVKRLGDVATLLKGSGLSKNSITRSGSRKCILYGELFTTYGQVIADVESRTNSAEGRLSEVGDVIVPGSTTTEGIDLATASALLEGGVALGGDINIIRCNSVSEFDSRFLANYLTIVKKHEIAERAQGTTIVHLYGRDLSDLTVSRPEIAEQHAIATALVDMDAELAALEARRGKTRALKQGMMQELLTGRIRLL